VKLRPHQIKALAEVEAVIRSRGLAILMGEMRCGKTAIALKLAEGLLKGTDCRCLVLTRKKAVESILGDAKALFSALPPWLEVINYESAHKLERSKWGLIICDECHSSGLSKVGKPGQVWEVARDLFKMSGAKALLMSGTVAIETPAQLYHELAVTCRGPWLGYPSFYRWWYARGHYKDGHGGGYGVQTARKKIGGGLEVVDYSQVDEERIWKDLSGLLVTVSREDAGFAVASAKVVRCEVEDDEALRISKRILADGVVSVGGRLIAYETGAARLQGAYMALGGTLIDDDGEAVELPFEPAKLRWIRDGAKAGRQYVVFTHFIAERALLLRRLPMATDDLDAFKAGGPDQFRFLVLSMTSFSMGVDLSWISGTMLIYSCSWSGAVWSQVKCRMLRHDRTEPAIIGVPIVAGSIDSMVIDAVEEKESFNLTLFRARS
jgi:hypothetical protein